VSFWSRGGIGMAISPADLERPIDQRTPAFGDLISGLALAGGVAGALAGRAVGQAPATVDVSLQGTAAWILQPLLAASALFGLDRLPSGPRHSAPNPLVGSFLTADNRTIQLVFLQPDRYWGDFCALVDRLDLRDDPRFADMTARAQNNRACGEELDKLFASKTLAEWRETLKDLDAPWGVMQSLTEVLADPQVQANGYAKRTVDDTLTLVPAPVQYDETSPEMRRAPEMGADTELILMDLGVDWDRIEALKNAGVIN
jgi:crotonobetainyl-CoA:carnitine CoA-transferase CaiB-like acyl-CoA transferase